MNYLILRVDSTDEGLGGSCVVYGPCSETVKSSGCVQLAGTVCCLLVCDGCVFICNLCEVVRNVRER